MPLAPGESPCRPRADRSVVLGCAIDRLDMAQTVARVQRLIDSGGFAQHVSINALKLVSIRDDPRMRDIVEGCELVTADGQSVVWASRMLRDPLPGRVAGVDLMQELLAHAETSGWRVYILGARGEVLERAVARIRDRHPSLRLAGYRDGYFAPDQDAAVAAEIRACRPAILFVAISSPRKEYFLGAHGRELGVPFVMGVGGAVDVLAGVTRRAPVAVQRVGLEWLYRTLQEPRRLVGRYVRTNARFLGLLARELVADRLVASRGGGRG